MPRGGARPGAGRRRTTPIGPGRQPCDGAKTPLAYMLAVMTDPAADPRRRDDMAKAAAPFMHERMATKLPGQLELPLGQPNESEPGASVEWDKLVH